MSENATEAENPAAAPATELPSTELPATGLPDVDAALARLTELAGRPVSEHPDELAAAHEALHRALDSPSGSGDA